MRLIFLPATTQDFQWFRRYYQSVFPEGQENAKMHYLSARRALLTHPQVGHPVEGAAPMRELHISRTPFSLIYFIDGDTIVITRLLDDRAQRPLKFRPET